MIKETLNDVNESHLRSMLTFNGWLEHSRHKNQTHQLATINFNFIHISKNIHENNWTSIRSFSQNEITNIAKFYDLWPFKSHFTLELHPFFLFPNFVLLWQIVYITLSWLQFPFPSLIFNRRIHGSFPPRKQWALSHPLWCKRTYLLAPTMIFPKETFFT